MTAENTIDAVDKFDDYHRQQLSMLMDGELQADQARFLLRRLHHDGELGAQWDRWHLAGEVLRGRALAPVAADFAERIAIAIAGEAVPQRRASRTPWLRWGGGALAASFAAFAVFVAWPQHPHSAPTAPQVAAAPVADAPVPAPVAVAKETAAPEVRALAQVAAPAPHASRIAVDRPRAKKVIAVPPAQLQADASPETAVASVQATPADPFAAPEMPAHAQAKPWPHSLLQPSNSAFNASFDSAAGLNEAHPFAPQAPLQLPPAEPQR